MLMLPPTLEKFMRTPMCQMTAGGAEKSQQCRKYFFQYRIFASEISQVRTWGNDGESGFGCILGWNMKL